MAWPNRGTVTAKELLGMEADELKGKLDAAVTKDDLKAATDKIEAQAGTLSQIQEALSKLVKPADPTPDPNLKLDADDPTTQILTDPAGFINRQTAGTQQVAAQARADVLEMRARNKFAGAFQRYGDEIMATASKFSLTQRAQEGFWDYHIATFVGTKTLEGKFETGGYPSLMGSSSFAPNAQGDPDDPNKGFSADEADFYRKHNIPLEKAAKITKLMHKDGEPISLENFKGQVGHA